MLQATNLGTGTASSTTILYGDGTYKTEPTTDLTPVNQDILTLALRNSIDNNTAKYNLPSSAITHFESDADYNSGGSTDISRNASEYISTMSSTTNRAIKVGSSRSDLTLNTSSWTGSFTNDRQVGSPVSVYNDMYLDYLFDLSQDFRLRVFTTLDSNGSLDFSPWHAYTAVVTTDTSVAAGAEPTILRDQDNTINSYAYNTPVQFGDREITAAYATTIGSDAFTDNSYGSGAGASSLDCNSASALIRKNAGAADYYGVEVDYDKDNTQIIFKLATNAAFTTFTASAQVTMTEVPTTGRFIFNYGNNSNLGVTYNASITTTYAESDNTKFSWTTEGSSSATGTALGTTNVPTSPVIDVSGVMLLKNAYGTNTLGTDVKVYFTANNSAFTECTYTDAGTFSTGIKMIQLGKTTCTEGSDVRWKIVFANQVASSKEAHIYGMGVNY